MERVLRLYQDVLADGAALTPPAVDTVVYVVHGAARLGETALAEDTAVHSATGLPVTAGPHGAALWRWELAPAGSAPSLGTGPGVASRETLTAALTTLPAGPLLMRCDSVAFPPGGTALRHVHQGPGIRCLIEGGIRIDTHGRSTSYGPGGAWFEAGPDAVFAQAALDRPSRFVRVMVLPAALLGQSSIRYVDEADRAKPKAQTYRSYADRPFARLS